MLQSLEISLTAASQMLISLSSSGADYVWSLESQNIATFPEGPFSADNAALQRLYYAVDSTWISHTFAVTFLVLCYVKGVVSGKPSFSLKYKHGLSGADSRKTISKSVVSSPLAISKLHHSFRVQVPPLPDSFDLQSMYLMGFARVIHFILREIFKQSCTTQPPS